MSLMEHAVGVQEVVETGADVGSDANTVAIGRRLDVAGLCSRIVLVAGGTTDLPGTVTAYGVHVMAIAPTPATLITCEPTRSK